MDLAMLIAIIKKIILVIFQKYDVLSEFDALGVDVGALLGEEPTKRTLL